MSINMVAVRLTDLKYFAKQPEQKLSFLKQSHNYILNMNTDDHDYAI